MSRPRFFAALSLAATLAASSWAQAVDLAPPTALV